MNVSTTFGRTQDVPLGEDDVVTVAEGINGWYWHRKAEGNNEIISQGEGYTTKQHACFGALRANPDKQMVFVTDYA